MRQRFLFILASFLLTVSCIKDKPSGADLAVGDAIPDFEVTMNDGAILSSQDLKSGVSCIVFFHTSCPDCQQALPVMQRLFDKYGGAVTFALISREDDEASVSSYWKQQSFTMPYSPQSTREIYNLFAQTRVPRIYICGKGGIIKAIYTDDPVPGFEELDHQVNSVCGIGKE